MSLLPVIFALVHQTGVVPTLPPSDKVVVTVNGHPITAKQVEAYLWDWNAAQVGQTLAVFEVIRQAAAKHGIVLQDSAVKTQVSLQIQQALARAPLGMAPGEFLKKNGISRTKIEFGIRAQMLLKQLADLDFKAANYYRVATIVVRPKSESAADVQASLTLAATAYAQVSKGDPWDQVLAQTATDAQNVPNHGELGWIEIDQFPAPAKAELLTLKIGGVTKPVQTPSGIQIFRLESRGKDASPEEIAQLKSRYESVAERALVKQLQDSAKIVTSF